MAIDQKESIEEMTAAKIDQLKLELFEAIVEARRRAYREGWAACIDRFKLELMEAIVAVEKTK